MVPTMAEQSAGHVPLPYLRAWREYRGLSQRELGQRAAITEGPRAERGAHVGGSTIARIETGAQRAKWATVGVLARALGITREQLMREEPPSK